MKKAFALLLIIIAVPFYGFNQVSVGGIAFVGYNGDNPDQFTIILTEYLAGGTTIYFTDAGWTGTALYGSEGSILWTVPAGGLATNTMVTFTAGAAGGFTSFPSGILEAGVTVSEGTVVASGVAASMAFSTNGDEILAFTGSVASPTFIAAINFNGAWSWTGTNSAEQTLLPPGLTDGVDCILLGDRDNGIIDCLLLPDPAMVSDFNTAAYWLNNDATRYTLPPTIGDCELLLPITLLSFSGEVQATGNYLFWETAEEINALKFEVERSFNGLNFIKVGEIEASGSNHYYFTDDIQLSGTFYYRLRLIDNDFSETLSAVIVLQHDASAAVSLYPNPASNQATVHYPATFNLNTIQLLDITGKLIPLAYTPGNYANSFLVNTTNLLPGIYVLVLMSPTENLSLYFVKE